MAFDMNVLQGPVSFCLRLSIVATAEQQHKALLSNADQLASVGYMIALHGGMWDRPNMSQ